ncbi:TetR/AcrR family transcriptional regulator [Terasakiella sp. A23]|uniref:TetR/AcrR family transcriptional regulator n=1 Tax=Terasakiella sp. FCG-A23 TaxID=3080561 RepID=UPI0029535E0D|nr:TetR/AcrR family transcriptional regulator [Terasakiella sp. A23]MDV7338995.1 TetR/AcrR family transcriptional regulator [Terasakiella sp. A23]
MARNREQTRLKIITAAYEEFYQKGFSRSGVDAIAEAAGLTKRTLYDHFESKDVLIEAVLDHQNQLVLDRMKKWVPEEASDPSAMIDHIFDKLMKWMDQPRWIGSGFSRAALELADLPGHPARHAASKHKKAVEGWLEAEFLKYGLSNAKDCATQIMVILEGAQSLVLIHQGVAYAEVARNAALVCVQAAGCASASGSRST